MSTLPPPTAALLPSAEAEASVLSLANQLDRVPATAQIGDARTSLKKAITENEAGLHEIAARHASVIAKQLRRNSQLNQSSQAAQLGVSKLAGDFDVNSLQSVNEVESLRKIASDHQSSAEATVIANTTVNVIGNVQQHYALLSSVEDGIWSGRSADAATIADLLQLDHSVKRDSAGAAVQVALTSRCSVLRTMVSEQLSNAWLQAVAVTNAAEELPNVTVQQNIRLSSPKALRSTPRAKDAGVPPTFTLSDLCSSLESLGELHGILNDLYGRIIRNVVEPLLEHPTWRPVEHAGDNVMRLEITVVPPQQPLDIIGNVRAALQFVRDSLPRPCHSLGARLQEGAFNLVLGRMLVPGMPPSLASLPEWLRTARQAAEWETSLGSDNSSTMVVAEFMNSKAGEVWLDKRRTVSLRQARRIAYDDWSPWSFRQADLGVVQSSAHQPDPEISANDDDEDGWGFDDDPRQVSTGTDVSAPPVHEDTENDGWAFDEVEIRPVPASTPLPKPREAKRLGKKAGNKAAREESSDLSAVVGDPSPEHETNRRTSTSQASTLSPQHTSTPPHLPTLSSQYRVSLAADNVLRFAQSALDEMSKFSSLHLVEWSFDNVLRGISAQLAEALDLIRASVPVAQSKSIETTPINMVQLANDYRYLSYKLTAIAKDVEWPDRDDAIHRFATASAIALESFVVTQTTVITDLMDRTHGFVDSFNSNSYAEADDAVQQVVAFLNDAASQLATYVDANVYQTVLGKLVQTTVAFILHSVLSLEDITEVESQRIGSTLAHVEELGELFQQDPANVSTAAAFVPHWIKFGYLIEILQANLLEITHLFDNGSLIDFTSEELGRLIRALFADSPQRATLLDKIEM